MPEGYHEPEKNLRYCQYIIKARKGESFIIPADLCSSIASILKD
ncbi:MAG: hypothetical protein QM426_12350 [Euryarchaeota archaeon]|nr:hypothetical protein [Euryarchaeota archaeon]